MQHSSKITSFLAVVACVTLMLAGTTSGAAPQTTPPPATQPANLILNPGAEQGSPARPSIWFMACVPADGMKMSRDSTTAHSGKASLMITNTHKYDQLVCNNWGQSIQKIPAEGTTVVLSGWIKTQNAETANICIQCWDGTKTNMLGFASTPEVSGDQDWTELTSDPLEIPKGTKSIIVRAALSGTGKAWFDDITLKPAADKENGGAASGPGTQPTAGASGQKVAHTGPRW